MSTCKRSGACKRGHSPVGAEIYSLPEWTPQRCSAAKATVRAQQEQASLPQEGVGGPPQEPPRFPPPTAQQGPDPPRLPLLEACLHAWAQDVWGTLCENFGELCFATAIIKAVGWWMDTTEAVTKTKVLSWTGDTRVNTRRDLAAAFQGATSAQLGDQRLVVKSDLAGVVQRVDDLESDLALVKLIQVVTFAGMVVGFITTRPPKK